jgi:hypothetical protein
MEIHQGHIIEKVIRRNGHSITDIARMAEVNRRSVYNWFNQRHLKQDVIIKIGRLIKHDFSLEFPDLFTTSDFVSQPKRSANMSVNDLASDLYGVNHWKDKYIDLLERYNSLIVEKAISINELKPYILINLVAVLYFV